MGGRAIGSIECRTAIVIIGRVMYDLPVQQMDGKE